MNDLLAELEVEERQLVEYAYLYGYKAREIARALGVAEETVKKRKHRVMKKLKKIVRTNNAS